MDCYDAMVNDSEILERPMAALNTGAGTCAFVIDVTGV